MGNFFENMHICRSTEEDLLMKPKLIVLVGPAGSGKSTLAKSSYPQSVYINQDAQGKQGHKDLFTEALSQKQDIICDRMNFNKEQRNRYLAPAKEAGYETEIVILHESKETCFKRCAKRNEIGDHPTIRTEKDASKAINFFFDHYERVEDSEADQVTRIWPEKDMKLSTIVCDIDNTLSDSNHRSHHLQNGKKNWGAFFSEMNKDPVNEWCKRILNTMRPKNLIVLCSGRPDSYREVTKKWLEDNKVQYDYLFMRPRNDQRQDDTVKEIIMEWELKTQFDISFWIDDRKQVIEKIRKHGIIVLDCAGPKGDF